MKRTYKNINDDLLQTLGMVATGTNRTVEQVLRVAIRQYLSTRHADNQDEQG